MQSLLLQSNRSGQHMNQAPEPSAALGAHLVMQGSQKACPQRSTSGLRPSGLASLFPPFLSVLLPLAGALLGPAAAAAPLLPPAPSRGAEGLASPSAPSISTSIDPPAAAAAARRVAVAARELPAAASAEDPAGADGLGGAGAGERADAAARAAAAAPAAVSGVSKSSRQIGQLLDAYCCLRMAAWSRLIAASLSAHACRSRHHTAQHSARHKTAGQCYRVSSWSTS